MIAFVYVALIMLFWIGSFVSGYYGFIPGIVFCVSMSGFSGWKLAQAVGRISRGL